MTKIVVLDGHAVNPGDNPWDDLDYLGDLTVHDRSPEDKIIERAREAEILLTNKTPLDAETIASLPKLKLIVMLATGYDNVDIKAAGERGIPVSNAPGYATGSVAQFVFALLLEHCNRVCRHDAAVKAGEWEKSEEWSLARSPQKELSGKTMGIVGFGDIGHKVGEIANAMGMSVYVYNPRPKREPGYRPFGFGGLEQVFAKSDVVSLHCPLTEENRAFVDARLLGLMKPEAYLVNTSRGELINEADLAEALNSGKIAGAALDVASQEPLPQGSPLVTARNIVLTPHIAWSSLRSRRTLMRMTAETVRLFLRGKATHVVNKRHLSG
jgi:glycerate dehydrogenase